MGGVNNAIPPAHDDNENSYTDYGNESDDSEVYTENDDENDNDDSPDDDDDHIQNEWFSSTAMLGVTNAIAPTLGNITRKNWKKYMLLQQLIYHPFFTRKGEFSKSSADDNNIQMALLVSEALHPMHYRLMPIKRGQFRFANFAPDFEGKCHFHFLIH